MYIPCINLHFQANKSNIEHKNDKKWALNLENLKKMTV